MADQIQVPEGFRLDAQGRHVPESMIKPLDLMRDELVMAIVGKTQELNQALVDFKAKVFGEVDALVAVAADEYGAKLGGAKGNVTLFSYDGRYKVVRAKADNIRFDERLQGAKALIDECLQEWVKGSRPEIITLINDAFKVDQAGNIRTGSVLALRRLEITDERWIRAMQAISDAVTVVTTSSYVRVYERVGDTDRYEPISLDIAKV
ncbi:DUF3164 family protein [Ectopseudomonas oleovorans]|uniref:DUF3164 family protein n=1 Tax=Ectopseudomonas oleovorans TaxID=301 RepID=A0AA42TU35_ECTOL|nr:DUF3164 family protein [Pseudomonas oleovorans]MDH1339797.1 DUF3164 family protein [Pseudomonas oleovorans]MDH1492647.1 DUF3164 family protein [Pseudomonas oleovorans]WGG21670.1 DUF3164 family protein [Pseudomonas oleovorans]